MAAFAVGEIESLEGADAILKVLRDTKTADSIRARAVEAAGKIALPNLQTEKSKQSGTAKTANEEKAASLGEAILDALEFEDRRGRQQSRETVLLGLTAALRVRPDETNIVAARFLTSLDARVRTDAANTLARIRAKNANEALRAILLSDNDGAARANAARALGAAEDKESFNLLLEAAASDEDLRVRVSAIRSLGALKDAKAAEKLLERGEKLLADYKKSKFANPPEKNELLEIASLLGKLLPKTSNERAVKFLDNLRRADKYTSAETEIALARVAPKLYFDFVTDDAGKLFGEDWRTASAAFQGLGEFANLEANQETDETKVKARLLLIRLIGSWVNSSQKNKLTGNARFAIPDLIRAFAAFKSDNNSNIFRPMLEIEPDIFIRAAIAEVLGEQKPEKENVEALIKAFDYAVLNDKDYNDAQLAILDALFKLDKKESVPTLWNALNSKDFLVRKKGFELLRETQKDSKLSQSVVENALNKNKLQLLTYSPRFKTRTNLKHQRRLHTRRFAQKRKDESRFSRLKRELSRLNLLPEDAPLTVDNFIKLRKVELFQRFDGSPRRAEFRDAGRRPARRRQRRSGLGNPLRNKYARLRTRRGRNGAFRQRHGRLAVVRHAFAAAASRRRLYGFRTRERN